jgi:two-component system response regulator YesN
MYKTLLVDDREIFIREIKRMKVWGQASSFEITGTAGDGTQALELLRSQSYDLVITDIRMPKLDGIGLLQAIKTEGLCSCVVLLSEYSEFEYAQRGLVLGAFDYLVKPENEEGITALLTRVRRFLDGQSQWTDHIRYAYPLTEEQHMIACIGTQSQKIPKLFHETIEETKRLLPENDPHLGSIIHKLYSNIIRAVFRKYAWLRLYTTPEWYEQSLPRQLAGPDEIAGYERAIETLFASIEQLFPLPLETHASLYKICAFILENPESEISLNDISRKFFMNHTYLSNLFRKKTGVRFNTYITLIRMARARYLIEHSDMKIYEISLRLGYCDTDYFNRLFKKIHGRTPTDYRKNT